MAARDYQAWGVSEYNRYCDANSGHPLVVMPTGTGKSFIPPLISVDAQQSGRPYGRVAVLTHVKELIEQDEKAFRAVDPRADIGVISAGLKRQELGRHITIAGIASVFREPQLIGPVDTCYIDEAHLVSPKDETMYRQLFAALVKLNRRIRFTGLTATPFRLGQGTLLDGDDALFTDIAVDMTSTDFINWFVADGYLVPLVSKRTVSRIDLSGVSLVAGDYNQKQLLEATTRDNTTEKALEETMYYGAWRRKWLIFCAGIEHAQQAAEYLNRRGIPTACVHSKMKDAERDAIIAAYRKGVYRAITNNGVLTTGYDDAMIDLIAVLRGTKSSGLWVQMLGRGTRPDYAAGYDLWTTAGRLAAIANSAKRDCLVLDFAGNIECCGPFNDPLVPAPKGSHAERAAPVRLCQACHNYSHAAANFCTVCGLAFPVRESALHLNGTASDAAIMVANAEQRVIGRVPVDRIKYTIHHKPGGPDCFRVTYHAGISKFSGFWLFDHGGYSTTVARQRWRQASTDKHREPPHTVAEAYSRITELRTPTALLVWSKRPYPEILDAYYQ